MIKKVFLIFVITAGLIITGNPGQVSAVSAVTDLEVIFDAGRRPPDPMFLETDFKPGDCVTKWAKITNRTTENQEIIAELKNYVDQHDMGKVFNIEIKKFGSTTALYSGTLREFFDFGKVILDSSAQPGVESQYDIKICFQTNAPNDNDYQEKTLSFNIDFTGIWGGEGDNNVGGDADGGNGFSPSSGGGWSSSTGTTSPGIVEGVTASVSGGPAATGKVLGESTQRLPQTGLPFGFLLLAYSFAILPFLRKSR